jgi:DNA-binding response OmpR family regulator
MARVLFVEDDKELCHLVKEYLVLEGMDVTLSHDGREVLDLALSNNYDVVVLDVVLPGGNGLHLLRKLRIMSSIGIIMLTARSEETDRVIGLEHGADDYIAKPCSPRELAARIRAVLRRLKPSSEQNLFDDPQRVEIGDVSLDKGSRHCSLHGEAIRLTDTEFQLLEVLLRSRGNVVTRKELMQKVFDRQLSPLDRSIDVHISNLRRKLGSHTDGSERIRGIRNVGYLYALPSKTNIARR